MNNVVPNPEDNSPGIYAINFIPVVDVISIPKAKANGYITDPVLIKEGAAWNTIHVTVDSNNFDLNNGKSAEGSTNAATVSGFVAGDASWLVTTLDEMADYEEYLIVVTDGNDQKRLIGSIEHPAKFDYKLSYNGRRGYTLNFKCTSPAPPYYYQSPVVAYPDEILVDPTFMNLDAYIAQYMAAFDITKVNVIGDTLSGVLLYEGTYDLSNAKALVSNEWVTNYAYAKGDTYSADEVDDLLAGIDLSDYYSKSETYSQTEVDDLIAAIDYSSYATITYVDSAIDSAVVGLLDDRGNYDASSNLFPSTGGSGTAGAILKGDLYTISVAGTLGGVAVTAGDVVRALTDTPGQTAGNWSVTENNLGYVPVNSGGSYANPSWITSLAWSKITSTPTTLSGYGITDAIALTTGTLAQFAATTSAQLAGIISDETGSGALVFATSPTLVTPVLGVASATSYSITGTAGAGFVKYIAQSSAPTVTTSPVDAGVYVYVDASKNWSITKLNAANSVQITSKIAFPDSNATFTLPTPAAGNADTIAVLGTAQTYSATNIFSVTQRFSGAGFTFNNGTSDVTALSGAGVIIQVGSGFTTVNIKSINIAGNTIASALGNVLTLSTNQRTTAVNSDNVLITTGTSNGAKTGDILISPSNASGGGSKGNVALLTNSAPAWNSGANIAYVADRTASPTADPASGLYIYSESGKLRLREVGMGANHYVVSSAGAGKVTASAPYTNDGYYELYINGTTVKFMTTA